MEVIVLDSEAFEQLKSEFKGYVKQALKEFMQEKLMAESSDWISIEEARKLLPYKAKSTWQNLRDTGTIVFTQSPNSRNILYSRKSILAYLNKNTVKF
jgi:predicted glycosyl hydrolase (DUF1957 family)